MRNLYYAAFIFIGGNGKPKGCFSPVWETPITTQKWPWLTYGALGENDFTKSRWPLMLRLVLKNCVLVIFIHSKPELLTQFPASNDEKYVYLWKILNYWIN